MGATNTKDGKLTKTGSENIKGAEKKSNDERGTNISMTSADKGDTKTLKKTRNDLKKNYKHGRP